MIEAEIVAVFRSQVRGCFDPADGAGTGDSFFGDDGSGGAISKKARTDQDAGIVIQVRRGRAKFHADYESIPGLTGTDKGGGLLEGRQSGSAAHPHEIEKRDGGGEAQFLGEVAGQSRAEIPCTGGDKDGVDVRDLETGFLQRYAGGGFGERWGVLTEPCHHGVRIKDKGVFDSIQGEVTGFDSVAVAEDFAKKGAGAGSQLMEFWRIFQGLENFGLSKGSWWDCGANGVEVHDESSRKFKKVRWLTCVKIRIGGIRIGEICGGR